MVCRKGSIKIIKNNKMNNNPEILVIDLFAGGGGVTTGIKNAEIENFSVAKVIIAVNHDRLAIESHAANHPETIHFTEDIKTLDVSKLLVILNFEKLKYPNAKVMLWASLECTNFSKAKGGKPRDGDSRTLAGHLYRYIDVLNPDMINIENVTEFMSWGPMDDNGKPISKRNGVDYLNWVKNVESFGYSYDYKIMNTADYGAYTSRVRYFGMFVKPWISPIFPEASHSKKPSINGMFGTLKKWKPVKDVLNFQDEGNSIFGRKKPLVEKTMERIYHGLIKFVANGDNTFITKYYSGHPEHKNISVEGPAGTIKTVDGQAVVKSYFMLKYNSMNKNGDMKQTSVSTNLPCHTLSTQGRLSVVSAFLMQYHGKGINTSLDSPATTLSTHDRLAFIKSFHIYRDFGTATNQSIESPAGALMANPKMNLIETDQWILNPNFNNVGSSVEEPAQTIMACRKHHYLMNPQYASKGSSIDDPSFTLIARMDKAPPYMVTVEATEDTPEEIAILVFETDSPWTIKIKEFMAAYGIFDIKMRMLQIDEMKLITGLPKDYILKGSQADQKKFIGNAVPCLVPQRWVESIAIDLINKKIKVA